MMVFTVSALYISQKALTEYLMHELSKVCAFSLRKGKLLSTTLHTRQKFRNRPACPLHSQNCQAILVTN